MVKKFLVLILISISFSINAPIALADTKGAGDICNPATDTCVTGYSCQQIDPKTFVCQKADIQNIFGKIQAPAPLAGFLQKDPTGAGAINNFLSNAIILIYSLAAIVLIFMLIWGAFEWLTSGGDKEKISSAQKRIINAFIGIILFAVAFAIIAVLGQFTGFTFFAGQNATHYPPPSPQ